MKFLVVRLGALGDIVHTLPAAAALRRAYPGAQIDWVVERRHADFAALVTGIDRLIVLERASAGAWIDTVRRLRAVKYDVALDFQGLMKSAVIARASGAARVAGFSIWHLREKAARALYSVVPGADPPPHVIRKNLDLLSVAGVTSSVIEFPLVRRSSRALEIMLDEIGREGGSTFALVNPGAGWPNKRWLPERFGEIAVFLREVRGLPVFVLWGPGEAALAQATIDASAGVARLAPPTTAADLVEVTRAAAVLVSGDTGPLHIAAAVGTPVVALFGPTDPARNGPWSPDDAVVSRYGACRCRYERRCHERAWCLAGITVAEVTAAIQQRLGVTRA